MTMKPSCWYFQCRRACGNEASGNLCREGVTFNGEKNSAQMVVVWAADWGPRWELEEDRCQFEIRSCIDNGKQIK
ncbi:hypothetical protein CERSUDRAFT_89645 [Gelatoporia subvermispora B]|uniref:Uncharacterized protein n=1 Tax=Ceriporiopsis subvermispora (strain B) TaxID=914234 RepID=M2QFP7_CERS8|nr:hypothetical protein CERSUDRAFT_89645 [Gelatoporia subvermispora B]